MSQLPRKVRRTPRFTAFLLTGGLLGLLTGLLLGTFGNADVRYDTAATLGFLGLICSGLGVLLGATVAVLLDKRH